MKVQQLSGIFSHPLPLLATSNLYRQTTTVPTLLNASSAQPKTTSLPHLHLYMAPFHSTFGLALSHSCNSPSTISYHGTLIHLSLPIMGYTVYRLISVHIPFTPLANSAMCMNPLSPVLPGLITPPVLSILAQLCDILVLLPSCPCGLYLCHAY